MRAAFFDTHKYEMPFYKSLQDKHSLNFEYFEFRLNETTCKMASEFEVISCFVNDKINREVLAVLAKGKTKLITLRSAGFNHVDVNAAKEFGITVVRVPEYSPHAIAEHALAMILCLNRKLHRAYQRVREGNFSLDGLMGFDLFGKTIGVIGTGRIGYIFSKIMFGIGCKILAYDQTHSDQDTSHLSYVSLEELLKQSDVISLHVPLNKGTFHLIDKEALSLTKKGVFVVNTGRGALIDSKALINSLKSGHIGAAALDVYEEEEGVFFEDLSEKILQDDQLARLLSFHNVLLTSHQAFFTKEALENIAATTVENILNYTQKREFIASSLVI
ncbi:MAG: 2-hydroxyacid dehydrogenase [Bdellovibrionota bacterium]